MDLDDTICFCFHVTKRKLVRFIERERPARASLVSECLSAGTGCGWCVPYLRKLHRDLLEPGEVREASAISAADYEAMRRSYLTSGRRPAGSLGAGEPSPERRREQADEPLREPPPQRLAPDTSQEPA